MLEVPEPRPDTAQVLEVSVDRFDRTVRRATAIEVRQHMSPFPPQRPPQLSKLVQPSWQITDSIMADGIVVEFRFNV
ncbi:hypothetical protein HMPREF3087_07170 [Brevibacterium sp. HMSC22B09]|nr:hypothetical protein HMPREF3087_07170 [Brevibacterium sp. HMSC22B09]